MAARHIRPARASHGREEHVEGGRVDEGSGRRRRSIDRRTATKAGATAGVVIVLLAILGSTAQTTLPPAPSPSGGIAVASRTPGPASTATPGPSDEPWGDLVVLPFEPAAELTPTDADRLGVAAGSSFTLHSLTATPAFSLAAGLRTDPPLDLEIEAGATADVATVRPAAGLVPGLRYRFRLASPDGALAGTWSFNARSPLHVAGTLPGDRQVEVPVNTGIEVTFDQDGTTGVR